MALDGQSPESSTGPIFSTLSGHLNGIFLRSVLAVAVSCSAAYLKIQSAVSGCMDTMVKFHQHMITEVQKTQLHQMWGYCQEWEWGWGGWRMGEKSQLGV